MLFKNIFKNFLKELKVLNIDNLKIKYIGRSGIINNEFKKIKNYKNDDKHKIGKLLNNLKNKILYKLNKINKKKNLNNNNYIDLTLPEYGFDIGTIHIITKTINEIKNFFIQANFNITKSIEIDSIYYNFDALNMPKLHPSRNLNETFYISKKFLLRTHTSNMQIHTMLSNKPPIKALSCGKVYRKDYDASHTPMFHQIEGFIINKNISVANLKHLLFNFLKFFFNKNIKINFRSSFFPFTEPSMEVDIQCIKCLGKKCNLCKYSGWIEILGCGMIHPSVLKNCNIDTKKYNGFAFGMGVERLAMIKYKINDIRIYFENNIDFLKQF